MYLVYYSKGYYYLEEYWTLRMNHQSRSFAIVLGIVRVEKDKSPAYKSCYAKAGKLFYCKK